MIVLAFVLRAGYARQVWPHPAIQLPVIDALAYRDRALEILDGDWLGDAVYYLDPLYPFFLAAVYLVVPPDSLGVLIAQAALDAASVGVVMAIAHRIRGETTALVAGLIAATYRPFFYYSAVLLKAPLMIFLVVAALYLVIRAADDDALWRWAPAGFLLGLAALTRGNSLLFAPALGLWILFAWNGTLCRRVLAVVVLGVGLMGAIGPVTARNW
ncbi:MAG: glycosyltransferase family 39 protein, partial [Myxococcota bacterium]